MTMEKCLEVVNELLDGGKLSKRQLGIIEGFSEILESGRNLTEGQQGLLSDIADEV